MDREDKNVHELAEQLLETGHSTLIRFAAAPDEDDEVDE